MLTGQYGTPEANAANKITGYLKKKASANLVTESTTYSADGGYYSIDACATKVQHTQMLLQVFAALAIKTCAVFAKAVCLCGRHCKVENKNRSTLVASAASSALPSYCTPPQLRDSLNYSS
jgi:hypothetical protein